MEQLTRANHELTDRVARLSHQQIDVPAMTATVTQHDRHAMRCECGTMHVAARPDGVPDATVSYGPNLQAWCVYLMVAHAIPVARCADLVAALTGSRPSHGFVHALIARAAAGVAESNRIIRTLITLAHVVSCDETPIRVGARKVKKYLLVACTHLYTWYLLGDRSLDTFEVFVLPDLTGVIVHDRYQNYDAKIFAHLVHQLCVAHLIRGCQDAAETYPDAHWPVQVRQALQGLVHAANLARAQKLPAIPAHIAGPLINAYRHGVRIGLNRIGLKEIARVPGRKQPNTGRCWKTYATVRPTSGRLTSEKVTEHRYAIRGYVSTVTKHGADVMTAIRDAILGRPWTPPAWAPG